VNWADFSGSDLTAVKVVSPLPASAYIALAVTVEFESAALTSQHGRLSATMDTPAKPSTDLSFSRAVQLAGKAYRISSWPTRLVRGSSRCPRGPLRLPARNPPRYGRSPARSSPPDPKHTAPLSIELAVILSPHPRPFQILQQWLSDAQVQRT